MTTEHAEAPGGREGRRRGRDATRPGKIPPRGWKDVLLRVKDEVAEDKLTILSAGIAFYVLLSIFPALAAGVAIYGLVADPWEVGNAIESLSGILPPEAVGLVYGQLQEFVQSSSSTLGWGVALSVGIALWSASKGAKALIAGINLAYDEVDARGFFATQGLSLLFTVGILAASLASVGLITLMPRVFDRLELGMAGAVFAVVVQWVFLFAMIQLALNLVYRFAPHREDPRWSWVSLGSFIVGGLWIAASGLFSWYAASFGSFNRTYGTIAGVVVLLLWLQITFFLILLGAELNAELEHQTAIDSTTGPPEPMGERGAVMADTLGEER